MGARAGGVAEPGGSPVEGQVRFQFFALPHQARAVEHHNQRTDDMQDSRGNGRKVIQRRQDQATNHE